MEIINIIDIIDIRSINEIIVLNLDLYNFISLVRFNNSSKGSLIAQDVENLLKNEFFLSFILYQFQGRSEFYFSAQFLFEFFH